MEFIRNTLRLILSTDMQIYMGLIQPPTHENPKQLKGDELSLLIACILFVLTVVLLIYIKFKEQPMNITWKHCECKYLGPLQKLQALQKLSKNFVLNDKDVQELEQCCQVYENLMDSYNHNNEYMQKCKNQYLRMLKP